MERIGERRLAIKWIQVEFENISKQGVQLSLFQSKQETIQNKLFDIEQKFPGKILNFNQKIKGIKST